MYIRHIDHRSGAPWGPHGREGGKKNSRQSREIFFPGKGPHGGAPRGGPMGGPGAWGPLGNPGGGPWVRRGAAPARGRGPALPWRTRAAASCAAARRTPAIIGCRPVARPPNRANEMHSRLQAQGAAACCTPTGLRRRADASSKSALARHTPTAVRAAPSSGGQSRGECASVSVACVMASSLSSRLTLIFAIALHAGHDAACTGA